MPMRDQLEASYVQVVGCVEVEFIGNSYKSYDFLTMFEHTPGEVVVIDTQNGLQLARVVIMKGRTPKATRWIVDCVDLAAHEERMRREQMVKDLKGKMEQRRKVLTEMVVYEQLAKDDPEMQELLHTYKHATGGAIANADGQVYRPMIPPRGTRPQTQLQDDRLGDEHTSDMGDK